MAYNGDVAVYRFLINGHFYTVDCNEAQTLIRQNNSYEGVQCYVASVVTPDLVPLYRLFGFGQHLYTSDETEKNAVIAGGWALEGVMGYVSPQATVDTVPLYRALNPNSGDHFYTTNNSEFTNAVNTGWRSEGIAAYVAANQTVGCAAVTQALADAMSDKAHLQAYTDCMNAQGFDLVSFLEVASAVAGGDGGAIAAQVAQLMVDGARNGAGCAALLTPAQQRTLADNQILYDRSRGIVPGHQPNV